MGLSDPPVINFDAPPNQNEIEFETPVINGETSNPLVFRVDTWEVSIQVSVFP